MNTFTSHIANSQHQRLLETKYWELDVPHTILQQLVNLDMTFQKIAESTESMRSFAKNQRVYRD